MFDWGNGIIWTKGNVWTKGKIRPWQLIQLRECNKKPRASTIFVLIDISGKETTEKSTTTSNISKIDQDFSRSQISEVTSQSSDETKKNAIMKNDTITSNII